MDGWTVQDHGVRGGAGRLWIAPVPRATNACQCSQAPPEISLGVGPGGHPEVHPNTLSSRSSSCFSAPPPLPLPHPTPRAAPPIAPRVPRRHSHTDNPANEGAAAPEGRGQ